MSLLVGSENSAHDLSPSDPGRPGKSVQRYDDVYCWENVCRRREQRSLADLAYLTAWRDEPQYIGFKSGCRQEMPPIRLKLWPITLASKSQGAMWMSRPARQVLIGRGLVTGRSSPTTDDTDQIAAWRLLMEIDQTILYGELTPADFQE